MYRTAAALLLLAVPAPAIAWTDPSYYATPEYRAAVEARQREMSRPPVETPAKPVANPLYLPEMMRDGFYHLCYVRNARYFQRAPNWVLRYAEYGDGPVDPVPTHRIDGNDGQTYAVAIARRRPALGYHSGSRPTDMAFYVFSNSEPLSWLYVVSDGYGEWYGVLPDDIRQKVERMYQRLEANN